MRTHHTIFHSGLHQFTFSPIMCEDSIFSTPSPTLVISYHFDNSWLTICISLKISDVEHLFKYLLATYMSSLGNIHLASLPIFQSDYSLLNCMSSLYIFDINFLLDMCFTKSLSHAVGCLISFVFPFLF